MPASGKTRKVLSREEVLEKLRHYCAYQERSRLQVERKMKQLGSEEGDLTFLVEKLTEENFLNEERFVKQFVRSRAAAKGWGPRKITVAIQRETGSGYSDEIQSDDASMKKALQKLERDLLKKHETLKSKGEPRLKEKLLAFCLSRGFDFDTSMKLILGFIRMDSSSVD